MPGPTREPDLRSLTKRLQSLLCRATAFHSPAYRSASPQYATEADLLTGAGSRKFGGRWNPPGLAAVYASLTPETAMAEALAHARYYGVPVQAVMPRTFVAISFSLRSVLDLTDGSIRRRLSFSQDRMTTLDWRVEKDIGDVPLTQILGQAAADIGLEGLLVPAAADRSGRNIVVFPGNCKTPNAMIVLAPARL